MKCPHCQTDLKYRERGGRRCAKCKGMFAFDPRVSPQRLHDLRFRKLVAQLNGDGRYFYTPQQLLLAISRKTLQAQRPPNALGLLLRVAIPTVLLSLCATQTLPALQGAVVVGGLVGLAGLLVWLYSRRPFESRMPLSPATFNKEVLERWRQIYGFMPAGLITDAIRAEVPPAQPAPRQLRAVLVCEDRSVLECLYTNRVPERLGLGLLPPGEPLRPHEAELRATLRERPQLPVLVLHDASAAGCLLAPQLQTMLQLGPGRRVIDLGIRPRQAIEKKLLRLYAVLPRALLPLLRACAAGPQPTLTAAELEWLERGYVSPLAAVAPGRLIHMLEAAAERLPAPAPVPAAPAALPGAQEQARAVGFMSWPGEVG